MPRPGGSDQPPSIKAHQAAISEAIVCACVSRSDTFLVRDGVWLNRVCAGDAVFAEEHAHK